MIVYYDPQTRSPGWSRMQPGDLLVTGSNQVFDKYLGSRKETIAVLEGTV
jgi:hypothetical protein